ncbi:MAG: UvrD-helicase domain-containing protein [Actinomycetia bacterium]|nr:UvrD-helicase domain-containing protein [Actinomycetes bacterium]
MTTREAAVFDITGPLPEGTTVLEASAGTGKTYAIAALALRYVAEGRHRLEDVLMITFGRQATSELRSRVYQRFQTARAALRDAARGVPPDDAVDRLLATGEAAEVAERIARIDEALGRFDEATIDTTHAFCARMLDQLGLLADHDATARTGEDDLAQLIDDVVADTYLRQFRDDAAPPPLDDVRAVARTALWQAHLPLADTPAVPGWDRRAFIVAARAEFERRRRAARLIDYDDLLWQLATALDDPATGSVARERLARAHPVVLVDEFQDTDPVQWRILARAFAGRGVLVLIGDPKQSIYGFRGADVDAYAAAVRQADQVWTLGTNYRSDAPVVAGVAVLFAGANLGTPDAPIAVPAVTAHRPTSGLGVRLGPGDTVRTAYAQAVQVRRVRSERPLAIGEARQIITADVVGQVAALLEPGRFALGEPGRWRDLRANDIAVLVSTNARGDALRTALSDAGLPAVFCGQVSVFETDAATAWQQFLDALVDPRTDRIAVALLTPLVGLTAADLATLDASAHLALVEELRGYARTIDDVGVTGVFGAVSHRHALLPRLLGRPGGERLVADLRHLAELLGARAHARPGTVAALSDWLRARRARSAERPGADRARRLETDADAVQVMTVHAAKGLQFPVVLLPQAADRGVRQPQGEPFVVRGEGTWALDPGSSIAPSDPWGPPPDDASAARWSRHLREADAEALRMLYVAATRARSRVIAWWASTKVNTEHSGLGQLAHTHPAGFDPASVDVVDAVSRAAAPPGPPPDTAPRLAARRFARAIDAEWGRTSYSGLTAGLHDTPGFDGTGPVETPGATDEPALEPATAPGSSPGEGEVPSPFLGLPAGTQFGSLVHAVLQTVDAASPTLGEDLRAACARGADQAWVPGLDPGALADALEAVVRTPLGPLADGLCLADVPARDRLPELSFELPLGGPCGRRSCVAELADLFTRFLPSDHPLAPYGPRLAASPAAPRVLAGWLTGSIDALLRLPGTRPRFFLVDYKTNRLGGDGATGMTADYGPSAMAEAMIQAHYPLQALLYAVAADRFLRWRVSGYDPGRDACGVGYLFVRGMAGPGTPTLAGVPHGVFLWRPDPAFVAAASRLLAGDPA